MAKTNFTAAKFEITSVSSTGTFNSLAQYITEWSGFEVAAQTQESHAIGDAFTEHAYTGLQTVSPMTIAGFHDDAAATGPHALLSGANIGGERFIKVGVGSTNVYYKQKVIIKRYNLKPTRGELTRYEAELVPAASYATVAT